MIVSSTAKLLLGNKQFQNTKSCRCELYSERQSSASAWTQNSVAVWCDQNIIRVAGKEEESIVDGPGLRYVLFVQGCTRHCPGCHNPETHDLGGGRNITISEILKDIRKDPLVHGVTFSGGEPFLQCEALLPLAAELKKQHFHLMAYTGFLVEELLIQPKARALLQYLDLLVDGPFILAQRSLELKFRGSANQRILDVQQTLAAKQIILWTQS